MREKERERGIHIYPHKLDAAELHVNTLIKGTGKLYQIYYTVCFRKIDIIL